MSYRAAEAGVPSADPGLFAFSHPSVCATARCLPLQQLEPVLLETDQSFALHLGKLVGKRAAVHAQVARHLLAREGDGKAAVFVPHRLLCQVGKHALADGLRGGVHDAPRYRDVLLRADAHEVLDDPVMATARALAYVEQAVGIHKKDGRGLGGHGVDEQLASRDGIGLTEHLAGLDMHEDVASSPVVIHGDIDASFDNDAQVAGRVARSQNHLALGKRTLVRAEAGQQLLDFVGVDAVEQGDM